MSDGLQVTSCMKKVEFAQIDGASLRRDSPHHIGEIFQTELGGFVDALKASIDLHAAALALHAGFSGCAGHEFSTAKINLGSAAAMAIIDRLGGVRDTRRRS